MNELIAFLKEQEPLKPLTLVKDLTDAACIHVKDQGPSGQTGHSATNGDGFGKRIKDLGLLKPGFLVGENISYGSKVAKASLLALAVDDGVATRGHRKNIFKPNFTELGSCNGSHSLLRDMMVLVYRGKASASDLAASSANGKKHTEQDQQKE